MNALILNHRKWFAFIGISLLLFGPYLDYTAVNVALPTIQQQLKANLISLQWVMNIYFLSLCVLATIMGRCGDLYGRRRFFYIGIGIFGVASIMAGFAPNIDYLIIGRLFQGVGASIVFPLAPSLLPESFPPEERGKAIAWLGGVGGIALALGPLLGGMIVTYWGWRWIFFINIPTILVGYLLCQRVIVESTREKTRQNLDWKGMILLTLTMSSIVLGLIHSQTFGWHNWMTALYFIIGVLAGITLIKIEIKEKEPLIDVKDFANLLFYAGIALGFLSGALSAATLFFDPLYLEIIRGESSATSGLILSAIPIAVFLAALVIGWLNTRFQLLNIILSGLVVAMLSTLLQVFFVGTTPLWYILIAFIGLGCVWAMGNTVAIFAARTAVAPSRASVATGSNVTFFNIGGSLGLSIAVVVYHFNAFKHLATAATLDQSTPLKYLLSNPAHFLQTSTSQTTHALFNTAFLSGFSAVMWFLLTLSAILLLSIFIWKVLNKIY